MKRSFILSVATLIALSAFANNEKGSITPEMLSKMKAEYSADNSTKAIRNALYSTDIDKLAINADNKNSGIDNKFSDKVNSKGITNQLSSGRCWLFTGLNVLRAQMMAKHNLPKLELSQNYNFFYDQLEKANLFLQGMIDNANKPDDDKMVDWLFSNPIGDGGQYTGISSIITKYGVVPSEVMKETYASNNTSKMRARLSTLLRKDGLELRRMIANKAKPAEVERRKEQMLGQIYRILAVNLGVPPTEFTWTRRDAKGNAISTKKYTPQSFYKEFAGNDLKNDYVMLMNDPSREYYKVYEIDFDRHAYDGQNWTYLNLPIDEIKDMAIKSIKDSTMMYFSCDVGKFIDRENGTLDLNNYDYNSLFGINFDMPKADRIRSHASASSHAMTLMAVNLDENGKPNKWMVENSWGNGANDGHLVITDPWFDEYMFRLVVNKKYVPAKTLKLLNQKPIILPAWDPMFAEEN